MESKKNQIIITNKKITDFYSNNKYIDIEKVNLLYIDLLTHIHNIIFIMNIKILIIILNYYYLICLYHFLLKYTKLY